MRISVKGIILTSVLALTLGIAAPVHASVSHPTGTVKPTSRIISNVYPYVVQDSVGSCVACTGRYVHLITDNYVLDASIIQVVSGWPSSPYGVFNDHILAGPPNGTMPYAGSVNVVFRAANDPSQKAPYFKYSKTFSKGAAPLSFLNYNRINVTAGTVMRVELRYTINGTSSLEEWLCLKNSGTNWVDTSASSSSSNC
jgi:hypothetical protein